MERPRKDKKILPVNCCGEHSHGKKDLVPDLELWGWGFLDFVGLFVLQRRGAVGCGLGKKNRKKSSVPATGANV